jgi:hypothetical protein
MQKVVMLSRMETFETAIFTTRLTTMNESFVPVGKCHSLKPVDIIWHEGTAPRKRSNMISVYDKFLKTTDQNVPHKKLWVDNCAYQNKNWAFYSFLITALGTLRYGTQLHSLEISYLEKGHTFMSADSHHHQIENQLKKKKNVYDF